MTATTDNLRDRLATISARIDHLTPSLQDLQAERRGLILRVSAAGGSAIERGIGPARNSAGYPLDRGLPRA